MPIVLETLDELTDRGPPTNTDLFPTQSSVGPPLQSQNLARILTFIGQNLAAFTGDSGTGGTTGLVPAPAAGDTAIGKFLFSDGTWAAPAIRVPGAGAAPTYSNGSKLFGSQGASSVSYTPQQIIASIQALLFSPNLAIIVPTGGDDSAMLAALTVPAILVGAFQVLTNCTTPNAKIIMPGATITIANAVTLTISGQFFATRRSTFVNATLGQGTVVFSGGLNIPAYPEWWGVTPGIATFDCAPGINAALACGARIVELGASGAYYIQAQINVLLPGITFRGLAPSQKPTGADPSPSLSPQASQIVMTNKVASTVTRGIFCGSTSGTQPSRLVEFITLKNFDLLRATTTIPLGVSGALPIQNPNAGVPATVPFPEGIRFQWCVNAHVERVVAAEHSVGFYLYGCVECYFDPQTTALRYTAGANGGNDLNSGFYLDYSAPLSANGGNASIYITKCRAFGGAGLTYSGGLTTYQGFVDLFVHQFETGFNQYGVDLQGDSYGSTTYATEDCHITDCVLDSPSLAGIRVQNAGERSAVTLKGNYCASGSAASSCILLNNIGGMVIIDNNQLIATVNGTYGINATNVNALISRNMHNNIALPIFLNAVNYADVTDMAHGLTVSGSPAVQLTGCLNGRIAVSVSGVTSTYSAGVFVDTGSSNMEIDVTKIEPSTVGGAGNRILYNGSPWGGGANFGNGNSVLGITVANAYAPTVFGTAGGATFTTPANSSTSTIYKYRMVGGGAGGGGSNGVGAAASGGGSGGGAEGFFTGLAPGATVAITIGAGGAGGTTAGTDGNDGNPTTVGAPASVTVSGGVHGLGSTSATTAAPPGGAGGTLTSGTPAVGMSGGSGGNGIATAGPTSIGGGGGASMFGGGGVGGAAFAAAGGSVGAYGSGGGGAISTTAAGGHGVVGLVIIERMTE